MIRERVVSRIQWGTETQRTSYSWPNRQLLSTIRSYGQEWRSGRGGERRFIFGFLGAKFA